MKNLQRDEQLKRSYVLHFIITPTLNTEEADKYRTGVNSKIQAAGGEIEASLCQDNVRSLAYPIGKESRGYFCESVFTIEQENLSELTNALRREGPIIRYMIEHRRKKRLHEKVRRARKIPPQPSALSEVPLSTQKKHEGISMDEIDKKLDEIIKNI